MNVLLLAIGSHGDVHPFVGIGKRLRQRGHAVTVAANEYFEPIISGAGLDFAQLGTTAEYERIASDPALWSRTKSVRTVLELGVFPGMRPMYELVTGFVARGDAVVAGSSLAIGMRVAEDKLNVPMTMVHLSPAIMRSSHEVPRLPGSPIRSWMPMWMKAGFYWMVDVLMIDRVMRGPIDALRREVGLPQVAGHLWEWWSAASRTIGLWPEWYGPRQPDWPESIKLAGFPLYDEKERRPMSGELLEFLEQGEPPVGFTAGSAMWSEHHFFEESAAACEQLNMRGLLLTRDRARVPATLPPNVMHVTYAPFGELFPRCAAVVHHGGIGTTAQALASGARQIVMPFTHDQLDNADRIVRLGVGKWIEPRAYRADHVATVIRAILADEAMGRRCAEVKSRFAGVDGIAQACEVIESAGFSKYPAKASANPSPAQTRGPAPEPDLLDKAAR